MKIELENIRLGSASLTNRVFAGTLSKDGKTWLHKTDVTNDFLAAAIARWNGFREQISDGAGKKYEITIKEIK